MMMAPGASIRDEGGRRDPEGDSTDHPERQKQNWDLFEATPKPKWEQLAARRLQNWGGIIAKSGALLQDAIPSVNRFPSSVLAERKQ